MGAVRPRAERRILAGLRIGVAHQIPLGLLFENPAAVIADGLIGQVVFPCIEAVFGALK